MFFFKGNRRRPPKTESRLDSVSSLTPESRKRIVVTLGVTVVAVAMVWSVLALLDRPVRQVEVTGQFLRVSPTQVEQAVLAFCKSEENADAGFITLDLDRLQGVVASIDWVDRVRIERRWPNGVRLTVTEQ